MEQITNYVKPELIVVAIALYFVGMALKQAQAVKDKYCLLYTSRDIYILEFHHQKSIIRYPIHFQNRKRLQSPS